MQQVTDEACDIGMGAGVVGIGPLRRYRLTARRQTFALVMVDVAALLVVVALWDPLDTGVRTVGLFVLIAFRWRRGLYRFRFLLSCLDEFPRAIETGLVAAGTLALFDVFSWLEVTVIDVLWVAVTGAVLGLLRCPLYVLLRDLRRNDLARERLLLVGGGLVADAIAEMSERSPEYGLELVARVPDLLEVDLVRAANEAQASTVLVAFSRASEAREVFEIRRGLEHGLAVLAVPRYFDLIGPSRSDDTLYGVPVLQLGGSRPTFGLLLKRVMDIVLALLGLLIVSPILIGCAVLVKRETGGRWLFRQTRVGQDNRQFELLKLQTMKPVAESTSDVTWTVGEQSQRVGPVGSFLRKTSLDESPQLWNILRGDMSFVGPRPERPFFVEQFSEQYRHYQDRLRMPAGLTGLAQIYDLRGDTSIYDRARFDNRYQDHWSLWLDIKIILKTIPKVFKGAGG